MIFLRMPQGVRWIEVHMIVDALFGACIFAAVIALLAVPFMPKSEKRGE